MHTKLDYVSNKLPRKDFGVKNEEKLELLNDESDSQKIAVVCLFFVKFALIF